MEFNACHYHNCVSQIQASLIYNLIIVSRSDDIIRILDYTTHKNTFFPPPVCWSVNVLHCTLVGTNGKKENFKKWQNR